MLEIRDKSEEEELQFMMLESKFIAYARSTFLYVVLCIVLKLGFVLVLEFSKRNEILFLGNVDFFSFRRTLNRKKST